MKNKGQSERFGDFQMERPHTPRPHLEQFNKDTGAQNENKWTHTLTYPAATDSGVKLNTIC